MIKITSADRWFSFCIRCRVNWTCEYAGTYFPDPKTRTGLHCSHFIGRGNWSTRFNPLNAFAHSYGSHQYMEANPSVFDKWVKTKLGAERYSSILIMSNDLKIGREYRRANKLKEGRTTCLAAHFKREYVKMEEMRKDGIIGRIEFSSYL